ncbi:MAG TPA: PP2C family protein-serine/threonine phosphatase [Planctomycetota bacterium]|nr:PP2C family protein-serine/threonine phosphatase [Planctomycetota bacterium]
MTDSTKRRRSEPRITQIRMPEPQALRGIAENLLTLQQDLEIARKIQNRLLPPKPQLPGYDFEVYYQPAGEVGGDFYDFIPMKGGKMGLLVADASGKGLAGALLMVEARAMIRTMASVATSPREILTAVNRVLLQDLEKGRFVTAFFALLDPAKSQMIVSNAGHTPMLLCREVGKTILSIAPKGLILGVVPDAKFHAGLTEEIVPLYPGDRFLLYSDGVSELMNPVNEEFGMDRLETWMRVNAHLWSEDALRTLTETLEVHRAGQAQSDDITILTGRVET